MSEPQISYSSDPSKSAEYWLKVIQQERKRADDNLRLAAERASVIAELRKELEEAKKEIASIKTAYSRLMNYRHNNTLNFQLEKLDDYLRELNDALEGGE